MPRGPKGERRPADVIGNAVHVMKIAIPDFVKGERIAPYVGPELREKLSKPLVFQWVPLVAKPPPPSTIYGYDATNLIDVCKAIIKAHEDCAPISASC